MAVGAGKWLTVSLILLRLTNSKLIDRNLSVVLSLQGDADMILTDREIPK